MWPTRMTPWRRKRLADFFYAVVAGLLVGFGAQLLLKITGLLP